ncbi:MAG: hypothetical protein KGV44_12855 [Flavobacteriaceae bacterium]|nr:hypothetical protein [Flavobacteriaceae bacterium]
MKNTLLSMSPGIAVSGATGDTKPAIVSAVITLIIEVFRFLRERKKVKK